jgi:hypothetical protein
MVSLGITAEERSHGGWPPPAGWAAAAEACTQAEVKAAALSWKTQHPDCTSGCCHPHPTAGTASDSPSEVPGPARQSGSCGTDSCSDLLEFASPIGMERGQSKLDYFNIVYKVGKNTEPVYPLVTYPAVHLKQLLIK